MKATKDFKALIDGAVYELKQGEEFNGTRHARYLLEKQGLIEAVKPARKKGTAK